MHSLGDTPHMRAIRRWHTPLLAGKRCGSSATSSYPKASFQTLLSVLIALLLTGSVVSSASPALTLVDGTSGGATATAFVTYCDSATSELGGCQRKLVVDLTLDDSTVGGSVLETDVVFSDVQDQAAFPRAEAPLPPATAATTLQVTVSPIRVSFRRGGVQMRYGLTYLREFPAALRDFVLPLRTATICDDGVTRCPAYTPLTGSGGAVVSAPLGVCCLCTSVACALTEQMCNASMRTHFCFRTAAAGSICVEETGVRYGGWSVSAGLPYYALNVSTSSASGGGVLPSTSFLLTTDNTDQASGVSRMQLLQTSDVDMTAGTGLPRLNVSQRVLFNPLSGDRVDAGAAEWMLVPTALVTVPGTECDKVGVTPEYFYSLSGASQCSRVNGTCLANQLEDLRSADVAAVAQGGGGRYLAAYLGAFTQETRNGQRYLLDAVERAGGATLRWSLNADTIPFTAVPVRGTLGPVVFVPSTLTVSAAVSNPNAYAGRYYVALLNCTASRVSQCSGDGVTRECVVAVLVRGSGATAALFATSSAAADVGGQASCAVQLRDAANATLASATVTWTVVTTTTTTAPPETKAQRCRHCAFSDLRCLFSGVCEWQMLVWTVVALAVTWCPYVLVAHWRRAWGLLQKATQCCCSQ